MAQDPTPANDDKITTQGRKDNAAQPLNASGNEQGAERYPSVRQDDAVERTGRAGQVTGEGRSFDTGNPEPRQGAGDGGPAPSTTEGRLGPGGDPVEGKR